MAMRSSRRCEMKIELLLGLVAITVGAVLSHPSNFWFVLYGLGCTMAGVAAYELGRDW